MVISVFVFGFMPGKSYAATNITSIAITSGTNPTCSGSSVTFTATNSCATAGVTYQWKINGTNVAGQTASTFTTTTLANGNVVTCTCTFTGPAGCNGSPTTSSGITMTINTPSTAPTGGSVDVNNFCSGTSGNISLTASGGTLGLGAIVRWYTGSCGGTLAGTGNPLSIAKPTSSTTYFAKYENACGNTSCVSVNVNVNSLPQGSLFANGPFCATGTGQLTWTATAGTGPFTVVYNDGTANRTVSGVSSGTAFNVFTNPVISTTIYTLVSVTDNNGCIRSSGFTGSSAAITINPLPQGSLTANGPFCASGTGQLIWTATAGTGPFTVVYNDGTGNQTASGVLSGTAFNVASNPVTSATTYTLVSVTDNKGCVRSSGFTAGSATIIVNPLPQGGLSPNGPFCATGTGQLTWTATIGTGPFIVIYNDGTANRTVSGVTSGTAFNVFTNPVISPTTYTLVSVTDNNGCVRSSGFTGSSATIIINPLPQGSLSANGPFCSSGTGQLTFTSTAGTGPFTIVYNDGSSDQTQNNVASGTPFDVASNPVTSNTTYTLVSITDNNGCVRTSGFTGGSAGITIYTPPVITADPTDATVCGTFPASFTISATGSGLTYQWYEDGNPLSNNSNISGATSAMLNIAQAQAADAGSYTVVVTGSSPCASATSAAANLVVDQKIVITSQPVPGQTLCIGDPFTLNVSATGTILSSQWFKGGVYYADAIDDGSGNYSITIPSVTVADAGSYQLVLDDLTGVACPIAKSNFAVLNVNPTPTVNSVSDQTVCDGSNTTTVAFSGAAAGTVYNWTNDNTSIGLGASGSGNIAAFTATNTGTSPVTATITVTPSYTSGGTTCLGTSTSFTITVNPTPTVNSVSNQTVCNGASTALVSFSGSVSGTVYNWTNNTPGIGLAASGSGDIAAFTAVNNGSTIMTATITVTPAANGCPGTAKTFAITVNPTPSLNGVSNQTVCNGNNTAAINFGGSLVSGTTYNWTNDNTSIGLVASGTGNIAAFAATNTGTAPVTATITVTPVANGCSGTSQTFTITVNPTPFVNAVSNQTVCNGNSTAAITFSGSAVSGTAYNWTNNTPSIGLAASGSGNIAAFTAVNSGSTIVTATITITPVANGCSGTAKTFTITVNPTPTVNAISNQTLCNGSSTTAVTFSGNGTTYNWTNDNTSIGLAASGTGNIAAFTATNTGSANVTATITVTPTANGCPGTSKTFTITVKPTPTVNAVSNQILCSGSNTTAVTFSGSAVAGTIYNWTNNTTSIGLAASGAGNIASFVATNTTSTSVTATITVTPAASGCTGTPTSFTITVKGAPTSNAGADQNICGTSTTLNANSPFGTGTWSVVSGPAGYTFGNVNVPNTTFSNASLTAAATYVLRWTVSNLPCGAASDDVNITLYPPISGDSIYVQSMCRDQTTGTVTLFLNQKPPGISGGSGTYTYGWEISCNGGSSWSPIGGATASLTIQTQAAQNCFYRRSVTSSPCPAEFSGTVLNNHRLHVNLSNSFPVSPFTITPSPTAAYCTGGLGIQVGTSGSLPADVSNAFTPYDVWYSLYLNGVLISSMEGTGSPLNFGYQTAAGTYTVTETISLLTSGASSCSPTTLTGSLTISIDQIPTTSVAGSNQNICGTTATFAGNTPVIGTGLWSLVSGAGTITTPASPTSGITALGVGNNVFKWTISNGTCPSSSSQVTIAGYTATVVPISLSATALTVCDGTGTTLTQNGGSLGTGTATWNWYSDPAYTTLVGTGTGAAGSIAVTPSVATTYYLRGEITSFTPCAANTPAGNITINVNKRPTSNISGNQNLCNGTATLTVTFTGTGPWNFTYSDGTTSTNVTGVTSNPYTFNVSPASTKTYTITSLSDAKCTSIASDRTGSATVNVLTGAAGLWTGAQNNDWFNCNNWANGYVPTATTNVTIPTTANSPQINSAGAQSKDLTINGGTLTFGANGTLEVYGNFTDNVASATGGFTGNAGTVIFSGSSNQTITTAKATELFYNLQINKTSATGLVLLNNNTNITVDHNLTLTKGIFVTGYNLFTWNNNGGTLSAPGTGLGESGSGLYTDSYIATSDASGAPLNVAGPSTPFNGAVGFRIKNVGNTPTYFPVGSSYLPAAAGQPPSPNRMMIQNPGTVQDFTVIVTNEDIGFTNGGSGALRVNRVWYVSASLGTSQATMQLFFTKRDWTGWGTNENEVEAGFDYTQPALVQKDYSGDRNNFINLSQAGDVSSFAGDPYNSEVYAQYTIGISNNLTNGIQQFNRFSIVNPTSIILPVTIINLKAFQKDKTVQINWTALNELNVDHYEVERSVNGISFTKIGLAEALNEGSSVNYTTIDASAVRGNNFYRIKVVDKNGTVLYSAIATVNICCDKGRITIYPNPVLDRSYNVRFSNMPQGKYQLIMYNNVGQQILTNTIDYPGGSGEQNIKLPSTVAKGTYFIKVFNASVNYTVPVIIQ